MDRIFCKAKRKAIMRLVTMIFSQTIVKNENESYEKEEVINYDNYYDDNSPSPPKKKVSKKKKAAPPKRTARKKQSLRLFRLQTLRLLNHRAHHLQRRSQLLVQPRLL